jgi:hypothetical protein
LAPVFFSKAAKRSGGGASEAATDMRSLAFIQMDDIMDLDSIEGFMA